MKAKIFTILLKTIDKNSFVDKGMSLPPPLEGYMTLNSSVSITELKINNPECAAAMTAFYLITMLVIAL